MPANSNTINMIIKKKHPVLPLLMLRGKDCCGLLYEPVAEGDAEGGALGNFDDVPCI